MLRSRLVFVRACLTAALCLCVLPLSACSEDLTEMILVVDTDMPTGIDEIAVTATTGEGDTRTATNTIGGLDDARFPITLGLVPGDNKSTSLTVSVIASNNFVSVLRGEAKTHFVEGHRLVLHLSLLRACIDAGADSCDPGETCRADQSYMCGDSEIDPSTLSEWNGSLLSADAGSSTDMSATSDAGDSGSQTEVIPTR